MGSTESKTPRCSNSTLRCVKLLREFSDWKVVHVPRAENKHADELVNAVLDAHSAQLAQEGGS